MDCSDDSVQWLGSQATCPALDNLLSEASFKPHPPEPFRTPREFHDTRRSARYGANEASFSRRESSSASPASTSTSLSPFASVSDSGRGVGTLDSTPFNSCGLGGGGGGTLSRQASASEYRTRHPRSSNPANGGTLSVPDCDRFFDLLEKASARINDSIRQDTTISRDVHKRQPLSKSTVASARNAHVKRVRRENHHSESGAGPVSEGIGKGKAQELVTSTDAPGGSARIAKSFGHQLAHAGRMMDVNAPRPSPEVMPPPPVPPSLKKDTVMAPTQVTTTRQSDLPHCPSRPSVSLERTFGVPSSTHFGNQHETMTQTTQNACPAPTPKLHSLLDPERRQRRLKLERTISASFASFSSGSSFSGLGSSSSSSSASHTSVPAAGQLNAAAPRVHHIKHHQTRNALPLSQDGAAASTGTRPPSLGMRRTNTLPLASRNASDVTNHRDCKVAKSAKQKFRPPLLSNMQQSPPTSSSSSSSRSDHASSHRSSSSSTLRTLHETSRCEEVSRDIKDEEMDEDLPVNSDADLSFGETVKFDIDMDALEEAMRQYD